MTTKYTKDFVREVDGKWFVFGEKGEKLSRGYASKGEATKRLGQIEFFKHNDSDKAKFEKVMKEFEQGTLKSSSGETITSRKQAEAIAFSEGGE